LRQSKDDSGNSIPMSFEEELNRLNEHFFFREFTFSKNTFRPCPEQELELADSILWLDDLLVAFQIKEREVSSNSSPQDEARWFDRKVLKAGTRQIRDTLTYLAQHSRIEIENRRGHRLHLIRPNTKTISKIVCYRPPDQLPIECKSKKYHRSQTAGVIHLIEATDYLGVVRTFLTPVELSEYFAFREELIENWQDQVNAVSEKSLVGQYLSGDANTPPSLEFSEYVEALKHRADEWDMSGVIKQFPDRITTDNQPTDYYSILTELAKLKRNELREFKKRFQLSMDKSRENTFVQPYRMACPRTNCGFVFIPLEQEFIEHRQQGLINMTYACKYDLRLSKCIGVSFAPEEDGWFSVEWCYIEFPWEYDADLYQHLNENNPFREVSTKEFDRYSFGDKGKIL